MLEIELEMAKGHLTNALADALIFGFRKQTWLQFNGAYLGLQAAIERYNLPHFLMDRLCCEAIFDALLSAYDHMYRTRYMRAVVVVRTMMNSAHTYMLSSGPDGLLRFLSNIDNC